MNANSTEQPGHKSRLATVTTGGIVGIRGSGRTEILNLLAAGASFSVSHGRIDQLISHIAPPDERLAALSSLLNVTETTPATYTLVDYGAVGLGEVGNRQAEWINVIRTVDWLAPVVPAFLDNDEHESVASRLREISSELVVADLVVVESRLSRLATELERVARAKRAESEHEQALLISLQEALEAGKHLSGLAIGDRDRRAISGFGFLTVKPAVVLINTGEGAVPEWDHLVDIVSEIWPYPNTAVAAISVQIEGEADQLEPHDRQEFLETYGITGGAVGRVSRAVYDATSTAVAYTWNASQVQAWPFPTGATAVDFAEMIHSDIARGFISAETISYDDLVAARSIAEARRHGIVRKEGRDYAVMDGDIVQVLFSR